MAEVTHKIEISVKSIIYTILILIGIYFLYQIRDILLFIFIGIMVMAAINPLVAKLEQLKLGRGLSIAVSYILVISIIGLFIAVVVPPLVSQISSIVTQIPIPPDIANLFLASSLSLQDLQVIANQLTSVPKILGAVGSAFSGAIVFFSLLVMSFYLLVERANLSRYLKSLYKNQAKAAKAERFVTQVEHEIGAWVRAEFILMMAVGILTFIGLSLLGIKYALALAIIAGLLEILPNIGPTVSAIPAVAIAYFTISPLMAGIVILLYVLIQQLENNLLVPMVMRQTVGLSPVITIILLLVGFRLAGVAGAALAIPLFLSGKIVAYKLYELKDQLE
jgi:predicted PurR-regulated permease PerM